MPSPTRPQERFGISPALATPLAPDGTVHVKALAAHLSNLLSRGCTSGTIFGTTGEGPSFGLSEREIHAAEDRRERLRPLRRAARLAKPPQKG